MHIKTEKKRSRQLRKGRGQRFKGLKRGETHKKIKKKRKERKREGEKEKTERQLQRLGI